MKMLAPDHQRSLQLRRTQRSMAGIECHSILSRSMSPIVVLKNDKSSRLGVTLTEVLMSLMIMSIGVSAVAVLFPISTLRSIQANQLTHGAIVKYNVEALIQSDPSWIFDPDRDGDLQEHFRTRASRNYIVDPLGFYTHYADGNTALAGVFGNDGAASPAPYGTLTRWGGGLRTIFGNDPTNSPADALALRLAALTLSSQGDGWTTDIDAVPLSLITTSDGAIGVTLAAAPELDLTSVGTSALQVPGTAPDQYLIADPELYRVVLFSGDGKNTQAYPLTHIDTATNSVTWSEDTDADGTGDHDFNMSGTMDAPEDIRPLPVEFAGEVSRVLLQTRKTNDFSWLLSVRRRSDGFARSVDIVVRYSDGVDPQDERLFEATFVKETNVVGIKFGAGNPPAAKKGKFILDVQNAKWYRIQEYREKPTVNISWPYPSYDAVVVTETTITDGAGEDQFSKYDSSGATNLLLNGTLDDEQYDRNGTLAHPKRTDPSAPPAMIGVPEANYLNGNGDAVLDFGLAMFPTGIIDVYPVGSMKMPISF